MLHLSSETERQSRMAALLERLHAKHSAARPWQETCKVVRQAMVRTRHYSLLENNLFEFKKHFFKPVTGFCIEDCLKGLEPVNVGLVIRCHSSWLCFWKLDAPQMVRPEPKQTVGRAGKTCQQVSKNKNILNQTLVGVIISQSTVSKGTGSIHDEIGMQFPPLLK